MNTIRHGLLRGVLTLGMAVTAWGALSGAAAVAQDAEPAEAVAPQIDAAADNGSATQPVEVAPADAVPGESAKSPSAETLTRVSEALSSTAEPSQSGVAFYPDLNGPELHWFAVAVILLLSFRARPIFCWRNLDGIMLSAAALLLLFRPDSANALLTGTSHTWQWWGYAGLAGVTAYWLLRGAGLVFSQRAAAGDCNVSEGAMLALILAALAVGFGTIVTAPLSAGSRDGVVGGLQTLATGKLPYGDVAGNDSRSPLLYLAHAGAMRVSRPTTTRDNGAIVPMTIANREQWQAEPWWDTADLASVRLVNGSLFVLVLLGLLVIGARLHSTAIGLTMFVLFAVFPGSRECLTQPDVMLPAALLTWSFAAALLPGVGGLLSAILLVFAGVAWPWAWLALPVLLAYFLRRGAQGIGALVGVVVAFGAVVFGLTTLTAPSLPRANGALAAAGQSPSFAVRVDTAGDLEISRIETPGAASSDFKSWLWSFLINGEDAKVREQARAEGRPGVKAAEGVTLSTVLYRAVQADDAARPAMQREYRAVLSGQPAMAQAYAALRTVAEATWLPVGKAASEVRPQWRVWLGDDATAGERMTKIRRGVKIGAGVLSLVIAAAIFFGRRSRPHQLLGGMLAVGSAALLADDLGAAANLAWLTPLVLALWANDEEGRPAGAPVAAGRPAPLSNFGGRAPTPRITIEG